jgi:hypothetical protein
MKLIIRGKDSKSIQKNRDYDLNSERDRRQVLLNESHELVDTF